MTRSAEPKARGLDDAMAYFATWAGKNTTVEELLAAFIVDEDELFDPDEMYRCESCGGLFVDYMPTGHCEPCAQYRDEWHRDTAVSPIYGNASGRTL
jgi:rubrerythrin